MRRTSFIKIFAFFASIGAAVLFPALQPTSEKTTHTPPQPEGKTPEQNYVMLSAIGPEIVAPIALKAVATEKLRSKKAEAFSKALIEGTLTDDQGNKKDPRKSNHICAKKVRLANKAVGVVYDGANATDLGYNLKKAGYKVVRDGEHRPGDIVVIRAFDDHEFGHAAARTTDGRWVSDFIQKDVWPYAAKKNPSLITFYRHADFDDPVNPDGLYRWHFGSSSFLLASSFAQNPGTHDASVSHPIKASLIRGYYAHATKKVQGEAKELYAKASAAAKAELVAISKPINELKEHWQKARKAITKRAAVASNRQLYARTSNSLRDDLKKMQDILPDTMAAAPKEALMAARFIVENSDNQSSRLSHSKGPNKRDTLDLVEKNLDLIAKTDPALEQEAVRFILKNSKKGKERSQALSRLSWRLDGPSVG